ncbi:MAG: glycosyltransferase family 2 protein [Actinomycetota bacterium]|nr:glycosyltransferase family 2 protein [Actinomycetota bacterium]
MSDAPRVCAAVITFNRRDLLVECIDALVSQTHPLTQILVIDNASTDGTEDLLRARGLLERDDLEYVRLQRNLGAAGGFAYGVDRGRALDVDWIWILDDDAEPRADALALLLGSAPAADPATVAVCPKVVYATGAIDSNQRGHFRRRLRPLPDGEYRDGHHPRLDFLSFVGALVRAPAARQTGLPREDFFIWGDDVEYSFRLRRLGEIRLVSDSVVVHKRVTHSFETARSRFWNRVLPVTMWPTPLERFWQNLCGLRNYLWIKREYEGQGTLSAVGTTLQFVVKHLLYDDHPLRRIPWIVRFARDGRRGRFVNIPPERWAQMVRDGRV